MNLDSVLAMAADLRLALSLAAAFAAAGLLGYALVGSAPRRPPEPGGPRDPLPLFWRLAWPLVLLFEGAAGATMGSQGRISCEARLRAAGLGRQLTPARHRAGCWVAALVGAGLLGAGWMLVAASVSTPASGSGSVPGSSTHLAFSLIGAVIGGLLPVTRLRDRAMGRQRAMLRQLPFFLDLVTMSVEAGLNLNAALAQAVDRGPPGPLREELAHLLRDLRAGRAREEALRALASRTQLPAVSNLVAALGVAHKQGASLGPILRAQAEQRRTERFLRAEKLAMEAPVKMLLPLALFIFPGTFTVLLFPVVSRLMTEGIL
jgi:tight adherence protein C